MVEFATEYMRGAVTVVPPPRSWMLGDAWQDEMNHLNLEISELRLQEISELFGLLVLTPAHVQGIPITTHDNLP